MDLDDPLEGGPCYWLYCQAWPQPKHGFVIFAMRGQSFCHIVVLLRVLCSVVGLCQCYDRLSAFSLHMHCQAGLGFCEVASCLWYVPLNIVSILHACLNLKLSSRQLHDGLDEETVIESFRRCQKSSSLDSGPVSNPKGPTT